MCCCPFASKAVFWEILKDFEFTVYCPLYKKDKGVELVLKGLQCQSVPPEYHITPLLNFAAKKLKGSRFSSHLPIEHPTARELALKEN